MMWGGYDGWGWWGGHMLFSALFWIVVVVAIAFAVRWAVRSAHDGRPGGDPRGESALDILNKRYARGEIGREEFEEKRRHIGA